MDRGNGTIASRAASDSGASPPPKYQIRWLEPSRWAQALRNVVRSVPPTASTRVDPSGQAAGLPPRQARSNTAAVPAPLDWNSGASGRKTKIATTAAAAITGVATSARRQVIARRGGGSE